MEVAGSVPLGRAVIWLGPVACFDGASKTSGKSRQGHGLHFGVAPLVGCVLAVLGLGLQMSKV
jgi:hypothetical protein